MSKAYLLGPKHRRDRFRWRAYLRFVRDQWWGYGP